MNEITLTASDARLIEAWFTAALQGKLLELPVLQNPGMGHVRQRMEDIIERNPDLFRPNSTLHDA